MISPYLFFDLFFFNTLIGFLIRIEVLASIIFILLLVKGRTFCTRQHQNQSSKFSTMPSKKTTSKKILLIYAIALYLIWLLLSFYIPYHLIISHTSLWIFFSIALTKYLIFIQPISILGLILLLTKGRISQIKHHLKPIIAITAILTVTGFTLIRWTTTTTIYGHYGGYSKSHDRILFVTQYYDLYQGLSDEGLGLDIIKTRPSFESETIFRELFRYKYDMAFRQIWTFALIVLAGAFLLIKAVEKKETKPASK